MPVFRSQQDQGGFDMDFRAMAEAVQPEVVAFRRDLHEHPEASFQ